MALLTSVSALVDIAILGYVLATLAMGFLIFVFFTMPKSGWLRWVAKRSKTGTIVTLIHPDGFEQDLFMKADLNHGVFTKGEDTYIFTPNPRFVEENQENPINIPVDQQKIIDEAIMHRSLTDTGKAHFTGLVSKGIAVTPAFLELIKKINYNAKTDNIKLLNLVEPQILKKYFPGTFSQALIQNIKFAAERRGFLRRPVQDFLSKNAMPIGIIIIIGIIGYMVLSGKIDLARIFGGFLPG